MQNWENCLECSWKTYKPSNPEVSFFLFLAFFLSFLGDLEAGKALTEQYGTKVDQEMHNEVLDRSSKLNLPPYGGFINPVLVAKKDEKDEITEVSIEYPSDFEQQMMDYGRTYSYL